MISIWYQIVRCGLDYVYMAPFCRLPATIHVWKGWNEGQYATLQTRQLKKSGWFGQEFSFIVIATKNLIGYLKRAINWEGTDSL